MYVYYSYIYILYTYIFICPKMGVCPKKNMTILVRKMMINLQMWGSAGYTTYTTYTNWGFNRITHREQQKEIQLLRW